MMHFDAEGRYRIRRTDATWRLLFAGDLCPMGRVERAFLDRRYDQVPGAAIAALFETAGFTHVNLESPLCCAEAPILKTGPNFRAHPSVADRIGEAGIRAVGLANNHILDQGRAGLEETISSLEGGGLLWHGAHADYARAVKPLVIDTPVGSIAFLNVAEGEFAQGGPGQAGAARFSAAENLPAIRAARRSARFVVVTVHAGNEHQPFPPPYYQSRYRASIDAGADIVVAHHPHIVQGVEEYRGKLICYSLGNFLFDYEGRQGPPHADVGILVEAEFDAEGVAAIRLHPFRKTAAEGAELLSGHAFDRFMACMERLSAPLVETEVLQRLWEEEARALFRDGLRRHLANAPAVLDQGSPEQRQAVAVTLNLVRCDAHRNALETALRLCYEDREQSVPELADRVTTLRDELASLAEQDR